MPFRRLVFEAQMLLEPINGHFGALSKCLGASHEPVTAERRRSDQGFVMLKRDNSADPIGDAGGGWLFFSCAAQGRTQMG